MMENDKPVKCIRCGRRPRSFKERMNAEGTTYICAIGYEEIMYPGFRTNAMEVLDETKSPAQ